MLSSDQDMVENKYENPSPIDRDEAVKVFSTGSNEEISGALLSIALYDEDWKWGQEQCLHFLSHSDDNVRRIAAMGLGHIARIHGQLDKEKVVNTLKTIKSEDKNVDVRYAAKNALSDIFDFIILA